MCWIRPRAAAAPAAQAASMWLSRARGDRRSVLLLRKTCSNPARTQGVLVATLHEHKDSVNCLGVTRDNLFLVSGSDDGTVRIWDCQRFKVAHLSPLLL